MVTSPMAEIDLGMRVTGRGSQKHEAANSRRPACTVWALDTQSGNVRWKALRAILGRSGTASEAREPHVRRASSNCLLCRTASSS